MQWSNFVKPGGIDGDGGGGRTLKVGDSVEFLISYERKEQLLSALSIQKTFLGNAPPPATFLAMPLGTEAYHELGVYVFIYICMCVDQYVFTCVHMYI